MNTTEALTAIPQLVVDLHLQQLHGTREPGTKSGKPTSRPPLDLTVVDDVEQTWNVLTSWTRDWCETYDLAGPRGVWTWDSVTTWLAQHYVTTAANHPARDEFDDEITGCARTLRNHLEQQRRWQPLPGRWRCPIEVPDDTGEATVECGGMLLQFADDWLIRCPDCARAWYGEAAITRLGLVLGSDPLVTLTQAAVYAGVHRTTVRRWIEVGRLPEIDGRIDRRDLAALLNRHAEPPAS